ncbi:unnamed protein product [Moneuplotes crassus]|uniref:Uncharacterized protein n=1 Tax=Euplotes crassus TaxID=5936 RepID=A0AAD1UMY2_EUPCR|nr:unnamed protein product [Moneuplotes crassus]
MRDILCIIHETLYLIYSLPSEVYSVVLEIKSNVSSLYFLRNLKEAMLQPTLKNLKSKEKRS